jgi:DNA-binding transcriptional MocR family regulator
MSKRKPYKHPKKGTGRHVQLPEYLQASEAWRTMKPGPRALYIELKRRFNGRNNGQIILSHRDAAEALAVHRNTVGAWFEELEARGFIWMAQGPYLGPSGIGQAALWALAEEMTLDMKPARKTFMAWRAPAPTDERSRETRPTIGGFSRKTAGTPTTAHGFARLRAVRE